MKTVYHTKKLIIIALILSLLFHTSIILYTLLQKTVRYPRAPQAPMQHKLQQIDHKQEEWVETKAGKGTNGAPIFFKDNSSIISPAPDTQQPDNIPKESTPKELSTSDTITSFVAQQPTTTITHQPINTITKQTNTKQQKIISQTTPTRTITQHSKTVPTLAQLTQGFINHVKEGKGQHLVSMLGSKKGLPSNEQMKYERYFQKLDICITNSFAINRKNFNLLHHMNNDIAIVVVLNKDGTPKYITLKQSSGNKILDEYITFIIRDASSSFPPVPHYLPNDPFIVTFIYSSKT